MVSDSSCENEVSFNMKMDMDMICSLSAETVVRITGVSDPRGGGGE